MLVDDEQALLQEMDENKSVLINLEQELQVLSDKLAFIKRAVSADDQIRIYH